MLLGLLAGCLLGVPLIVIYCFAAQVPQLGGLFIVMNVGVGIAVSALATWVMLRRKPCPRISRITLASVTSSVVVVTIQYAIVPGWGIPVFLWPFWGAALGAVGFAFPLMLQGPKKRRQSVTRSRQVSTFLHRAGKEWAPDKKQAGFPAVHDEEGPET